MFHGKEKNLHDLLGILNKLSTDDNLSVRQSIAYGTHEVCVFIILDHLSLQIQSQIVYTC